MLLVPDIGTAWPAPFLWTEDTQSWVNPMSSHQAFMASKKATMIFSGKSIRSPDPCSFNYIAYSLQLRLLVGKTPAMVQH